MIVDVEFVASLAGFALVDDTGAEPFESALLPTMLGTAGWREVLIDAMAALRAAQSFEAAVDALVEVGINVELLLVDRFGFFFGGLAWWGFGRQALLSDLFDLHAGVQHVLLWIDQDAGSAIVVKLHLSVVSAVSGTAT